MRSIRTQLVLWLVGSTLVLTAAVGVGIYEYMDELLKHGLDLALTAKAEAIASAVHMEDDGQPHLKWADLTASTGAQREGPFYFQIWRSDGSVFARSMPASMGASPLPRFASSRKRFGDVWLPDATRARMTELSFLPLPDEDEFDSPHKSSLRASAPLLLAVAHDRWSIDGPLALLMTGLLLAAGLVTAGIMLVVPWGVRRGLRPLAEVAAQADRIGPDSLNVRFPGRGQLPLELLPIGLKLNELLDRLATAFAHERRFSAAVAHELRTPLAELWTACDVALRWPDDTAGLSAALSEARDVAMQMSEMVHTLLSLARQQSGAEAPRPRDAIQLSAAITEAWPGFTDAAAERGLSTKYNLDDRAIIETDPAMLRAVLRSLLENAVGHTPAGGTIHLQSEPAPNGGFTLHLANTCVGLQPTDMPRLFEPFWRSDSARTGSGHVGLGLTLVRTYCDVMGIAVSAVLITPNELQLSLAF